MGDLIIKAGGGGRGRQFKLFYIFQFYSICKINIHLYAKRGINILEMLSWNMAEIGLVPCS